MSRAVLFGLLAVLSLGDGRRLFAQDATPRAGFPVTLTGHGRVVFNSPVVADLDGDGSKEIITGKRFRAHGDGDPGAADPQCLMRFIWNAKTKSFEKDVISYGEKIGSGMQIRIVDLDGDKKLDLAVAGKAGTYLLFNRGPAK